MGVRGAFILVHNRHFNFKSSEVLLTLIVLKIFAGALFHRGAKMVPLCGWMAAVGRVEVPQLQLGSLMMFEGQSSKLRDQRSFLQGSKLTHVGTSQVLKLLFEW